MFYLRITRSADDTGDAQQLCNVFKVIPGVQFLLSLRGDVKSDL
jgi:hypothetical protein